MRFQYRLAHDLGMMVSDLRHRMSLSEYLHWVAFYEMNAAEHAREMKKQKARQKRGR